MRSLGGQVAFGPEQRIERPPAAGGRFAPDDNDPGNRSQDARLLEAGNALVIDEQDRRTAVADGVADLQRVVLIVERHRDQPHPETGEVADDRLEAVRQQESHPIPFLEAHRRQPRGKPRRQPLEVCRGAPCPVAFEDRAVGVDLEGLFQQVMQHGRQVGG